mmetsp:Transcript_23738/g.54821  ORF Transcript_23738/g.54821 Transcript_23738/m.54821 type:complete len:406 (-) Transcript_23738:156-1373(-)
MESLRLNLRFQPSLLRREMLQRSKVFADCEPEFLDRVIHLLMVETFYEDDIIIEEGSFGDKVYLLHMGSVEVSVHNGTEEKKVAELHRGTVFGEMALFGHSKRAATVKAMTFCDCRVISHNSFKSVLNAFPKHKEIFRKLAAQRGTELEEVRSGRTMWNKAILKIHTVLMFRLPFNHTASRKPNKPLAQGREDSEPVALSACSQPQSGFQADVSEELASSGEAKPYAVKGCADVAAVLPQAEQQNDAMPVMRHQATRPKQKPALAERTRTTRRRMHQRAEDDFEERVVRMPSPRAEEEPASEQCPRSQARSLQPRSRHRRFPAASRQAKGPRGRPVLPPALEISTAKSQKQPEHAHSAATQLVQTSFQQGVWFAGGCRTKLPATPASDESRRHPPSTVRLPLMKC